jgi:two-component system, LytTR family, sensor kinase
MPECALQLAPRQLLKRRARSYFARVNTSGSLSRPALWPKSTPWMIAAATIGIAVILTLVEATQAFVIMRSNGNSVPMRTAFMDRLPAWLIVAALLPAILALARRFPFERAHWQTALAIHLSGSIAFAFIHLAARALYMAARNSAWDRLTLYLNKSAFIVLDMMIYALIVGVAHALWFYREARARELAASQLQASLTEARLAALRGQLNPHFLFNTLNAISSMALKREHENVVLTLGHLGELLRASLDDRMPPEIALVDELEWLEGYLEIQRIRFGSRLAIHREIDAAALDAAVPSMILQPLVENAIVHGVGPIPGAGEIRIRAERRDRELVIEVDDTGQGFAHGESMKTGVGLGNTRARLSQLYGDAFEMTLGAAPGGGARIALRIPYRSAATHAVTTTAARSA